MNTFVLIHGAFHGAWCWRDVAQRLQAAGASVLVPTLTGVGERRELLTDRITLATFAEDVLAVIDAGAATPVILVAHSFGGVVAALVAEAAPQLVKAIVFLDAILPEIGRSSLETLGPAVAAERLAAALSETGGLAIPPPPPSAFGVPPGELYDRIAARLTPQPLRPHREALRLRQPVGAGRPCLYVRCTRPPMGAVDDTERRVRGEGRWPVWTLAAGHDAMLTEPGPTAELLLRAQYEFDPSEHNAGESR